jgi:hypothetical protein
MDLMRDKKIIVSRKLENEKIFFKNLNS